MNSLPRKTTKRTWEEKLYWTSRVSTFFFHALFLRRFSVRQRESGSKKTRGLDLKVMILEHSGTFLNSLFQSRLDMWGKARQLGQGMGWKDDECTESQERHEAAINSRKTEDRPREENSGGVHMTDIRTVVTELDCYKLYNTQSFN